VNVSFQYHSGVYARFILLKQRMPIHFI